MIQEDTHIFQGMRRDYHPIKQDAGFLWDARNIRLTNKENETLFSITNEKGTSDKLITYRGYYVGHCVLGKYLVLFTANRDGSDNRIYRTEATDDGYKTVVLYHKTEATDNSWSPEYPIEALGNYETETVQKVYWTDNHSQPKVINIVKPELMVPEELQDKFIFDGANFSNLTHEQYDILPEPIYTEDSFDFIHSLRLKEKVTVHKIVGNGLFSAGTIQYAFSYFNKHEQESNIVYTTPLYYISHEDRGATGEERVANSFKIQIRYPDNYDYVRIYSIHRTSIDAVPTVKIVEDIVNVYKGSSNGNEFLAYTDTGDKGSVIDPTQLLYVGGESILAGTMAAKDGTLFLGNVTIEDTDKVKDLSKYIRENIDLGSAEPIYIESDKATIQESTYYYYDSSMTKYNAGFKSGETYRCGIQVQTKYGKWLEPVFISDMVLNDVPMSVNNSHALVLESALLRKLKESGIRRVRTCVVFPKAYERNVVCQGILCPTVFSVLGRHTNSIYAMSSWFFRAATPFTDTDKDYLNSLNGAYIEYRHNNPVNVGTRGLEIQGVEPVPYADIKSMNVEEHINNFYVDENVVTFHSPDLEFDTNVQNYLWEGTKLRIVGVAELNAVIGDIDIKTSSGVADVENTGFRHYYIGYPTGSNLPFNGGLVSGFFYKDAQIDREFKPAGSVYWMTYPWQKTGSINNDVVRPASEGAQTSVLSTKVISNLKFFEKNARIKFQDESSSRVYDMTTPQLFNSNEATLLKLRPNYVGSDAVYMGAMDSMLTPTKYGYKTGNSFNGPSETKLAESDGEGPMFCTSEPIRLKYKSSPHLVFSLKRGNDEVVLLPKSNRILGYTDSTIKIPEWYDPSISGGNIVTKYTFDYNVCFMDGYGMVNTGILDETNSGQIYITTETFYPDSDDLLNYEQGYTLRMMTYSSYYNQIVPGEEYYASQKPKVRLRIRKGLLVRGLKEACECFGLTEDQFKEEGVYHRYTGEDKLYEAVQAFKNDGKGTNLYKMNRITEVQSLENTQSNDLVFNCIQDNFEMANSRPYVLVAEIIRDNIIDKFGGKSEEALRANIWIPSGDPIDIPDEITDSIKLEVPYEYGDTWYQRYDCLKTYPFTKEDENQIVDIGSFMCETRVNIDGRTDRNRGQISNLNMSPVNFNLMNEVYSQRDNYFPYRIYDDFFYKQSTFGNQLTWSKEKSAGEDVDTWTNMNLANTLDMDGTKGTVSALTVFNDSIFCFQEKALSQILFNSREQIPVSDGVPIEISNGGKVSGSRILGSVGCLNKWSIATTARGIYFLDSITNNIYMFNGELSNLSKNNNMEYWAKETAFNNMWNILGYNGLNGIRTFYDEKDGDLYFTPGFSDIYQPDALCYSEFIQGFTSTMSYGGVCAMFNLKDSLYSLKVDTENTYLYMNNSGKYNEFFGKVEDWHLTFISNSNPMITKIFDTVELRTDTYNKTSLLSVCPFNYIEVSNEYQGAYSAITNTNMRKKFRIWRGNIPRASEVRNPVGSGNIQRTFARARIRNPWAKIKLGWSQDIARNTKGNMDDNFILHDLTVKYTV